jgi:hypothetical protein
MTVPPGEIHLRLAMTWSSFPWADEPKLAPSFLLIFKLLYIYSALAIGCVYLCLDLTRMTEADIAQRRLVVYPNLVHKLSKVGSSNSAAVATTSGATFSYHLKLSSPNFKIIIIGFHLHISREFSSTCEGIYC